jgi:hypothetical protein
VTGADLIAFERDRQLTDEGFTPDHDDQHVDGQLMWAAAAYLLTGNFSIQGEDISERVWPWAVRVNEDDPRQLLGWRPPENRVQGLVKAGALIAAEIDRLIRREPPPQEDQT